MEVIQDETQRSEVEPADFPAADAPSPPVHPLPRLSGAPYPTAAPDGKPFATAG